MIYNLLKNEFLYKTFSIFYNLFMITAWIIKLSIDDKSLWFNRKQIPRVSVKEQAEEFTFNFIIFIHIKIISKQKTIFIQKPTN